MDNIRKLELFCISTEMCADLPFINTLYTEFNAKNVLSYEVEATHNEYYANFLSVI